MKGKEKKAREKLMFQRNENQFRNAPLFAIIGDKIFWLCVCETNFL